MAKKRKYILIRHYCDTCGARAFAFDRFEKRTESPVAGKKSAVLLTSYNQSHREKRIAWCFSCKAFRTLELMTEAEILMLYASRKGVRLRTEV